MTLQYVQHLYRHMNDDPITISDTKDTFPQDSEEMCHSYWYIMNKSLYVVIIITETEKSEKLKEWFLDTNMRNDGCNMFKYSTSV